MHFLIVDDHPLYREALRTTVLLAYPGTIVEEAGSIAATCELLHDARDIDLVMLDLSMCDVSGFDGLMTLRKRFPSVPILVVSGLDEPRIVAEVMRYGAAGFAPKSLDKAALNGAIAAVLRDELAFPRSARHAATAGRRSASVRARADAARSRLRGARPVAMLEDAAYIGPIETARISGERHRRKARQEELPAQDLQPGRAGAVQAPEGGSGVAAAGRGARRAGP